MALGVEKGILKLDVESVAAQKIMVEGGVGMELGALIGSGMTAEVYKWQQDKVLKLFFNNVPEGWIEYEALVGDTIYQAGLPSPAVYGIIEHQNRSGIIYQQIEGVSMLEGLIRRPWRTFKYARDMARLQYRIHSTSQNDLPLNNGSMITAINAGGNLDEAARKKILKYTETLPTGNSICHGDFHPDNILNLANDENIVIDWSNAYYGHSHGDVARTLLMITTPYMPPGVSPFLIIISRYLKRLFALVYKWEYLRLSSSKIEDINIWLLPTAAARLNERIPGEEKWLTEIINRELKART